jgi:TPR repeat protein
LVVSALVALLLCIIACLFWPEIWLAPFAPLLVKPVTAFDETKAKAENGDTKAQFDLGLMYAKGIGVPKDSAEAVRWLHKAADQGYVVGQVGLGMAYANSDGVPKNSAEAVEWYRKAPEHGANTANTVSA